jgi:YfiH family protein
MLPWPPHPEPTEGLPYILCLNNMNTLNRSSLKTKDGLPYFEIPEMAELEWIRHAFLTRKGGMSLSPYDSLNVDGNNGDREEDVHRNRDRIATVFGLTHKQLILLNQSHQDDILLLKKPVEALPPFLEYDAMITDVPDMVLGIKTADCIPILIVDRKKSVIAAIHAGRQGTSLQITKKVLRKMEEEFDCLPEELLITLGPSIGPCCYEIDEKVFQPVWEPFSVPKGGGRWMVDLSEINIAQMKEEGIKENQISKIDLCTSCHCDLFFSYRKEGPTGRQLSFIGIT